MDYKSLFDLTPEPVWVISDDLNFLEVNQASIDKYGYSRQEFLAMNLANLGCAEDVRRLRAAIDRGGYESQDLLSWESRKRDGSCLTVDLRVRSLTPEIPSAFLVLALDASARGRLEEQLRQAKKMESVGMLAGGIAHDFNNLLTIISGYSQMLLGAFTENDPDRGTVEQILKASQRAADLTRQLLAFSRRQIVQPKAIELSAAVAGMSTMLHRLIGEHIDLKIEAADEPGWVHADPGQIEQIIMNLAVNARDAMTDGGKLLIETRNVELDETYSDKHVAARPGSYVMLAVTDSGTGMDAATQEHVFEPFFTTKPEGEGTGLGLSTVYGIVKQSGGAIDLYSEQGFGTSVKVYLPRVDQAAVLEAAKEHRESLGGWETILLAEDDEAVRQLVQKTLERCGYRLLIAAGGAEALKLAKAHTGPIQLLITDMVMPKMGGTDLARRVAKLRPEVAVLYMSGYTDASLQHGGTLDADMEFMQKPFSPAALKQKVREILDSRANSAEQGDGAGS